MSLCRAGSPAKYGLTGEGDIRHAVAPPAAAKAGNCLHSGRRYSAPSPHPCRSVDNFALAKFTVGRLRAFSGFAARRIDAIPMRGFANLTLQGVRLRCQQKASAAVRRQTHRRLV